MPIDYPTLNYNHDQIKILILCNTWQIKCNQQAIESTTDILKFAVNSYGDVSYRVHSRINL